MLYSSDPISDGEQLLDRAREVGRRITERVRKATEDAGPDAQISRAHEETASNPPPAGPPTD